MIQNDVDRLEAKLDALKDDVANLRVMIEHRMTKVEAKAGILGILSGAIGGWLASLKP